MKPKIDPKCAYFYYYFIMQDQNGKNGKTGQIAQLLFVEKELERD
jgi:hypothetical protein